MSLGGAVAGKPSGAVVLRGTVDSVTGGALMVRIGGGIVQCLCLLSYTPLWGDQVVVLKYGGDAWVIGSPSVNPPPVTTTVTSTTVPDRPDLISVVDDNGIGYEVPYLSTYTPQVNDVVAMDWQSTKGFVTGERGTTVGSDPGYQQPVPGAPSSGVNTFAAVDAGSYRGGWRTDNDTIVQGDWGGWGQNAGAWFYGGAINQALNGATVDSAAIYIPRLRGGVTAGQSLHLYHTNNNFRPAGDTARIDGPHDATSPPTNSTAWVAISTTLAQNLINGNGGVGIAGDPYIVLAGRSADPMTGAIQIAWHV